MPANEQRAADSAPRFHTTSHRADRMGHHDRPDSPSTAVLMVQHLRILGSVRQHQQHQGRGGQLRQRHGQRTARLGESRRPDRRDPQEQRSARMAVHERGRSPGCGEVQRLLCGDHHSLRLQRQPRRRARQQRHTTDARILREREIQSDFSENHRFGRNDRGSHRQQHLRVDGQRSALQRTQFRQ